MPPKPKFTRDQMITAAMNLIEEKGYESLTAEVRPALFSLCSRIWTN